MATLVTRRPGARPNPMLDEAFAILRKGQKAAKAEPEPEPVPSKNAKPPRAKGGKSSKGKA